MSRWQRFLDKALQRPGAVSLDWTASIAAKAGRLAAGVAGLDDAGIEQRLVEIGPDFADFDDQLAAFLAIARELGERKVGLRAFDVQLRAAAAMIRGTSVELATGEGKTLVGAIVAAGLAWSGKHTHVLSVNDYLAARDAAWMGPLIEAIGPTVGCVTSKTPRSERAGAYAADVVYIPVTEAGFDVLRDRLCRDPADLVGIRTAAAIVDEADAVLLDEAKVPLVLAGERAAQLQLGHRMAELASAMTEGVDFEVDDERRTVSLTETGLQSVEERFPGADLFGGDADLLSEIHTALHAEALLVRDVDYVVEKGRVRLVSQSRGRIDALQRWPEGLHEAVEAKENLAPSADAVILDQLLVEELIKLYKPVAGMSSTLVPGAEEILQLYGLQVGGLPPNRPCVRVDEPDRLFFDADDRDAAAVDLIREAAGRGQPVLVGTPSVAASERFAEMLRDQELDCVVLNAKNDAEEAGIIAQAGQCGRITVSTQMAGRGTDIRLGEGAAELGGLLIIALGHFLSGRLDDQLRGRSGRQGDPGRTVILNSLDDDLIAKFAPEFQDPQTLARVKKNRLDNIVPHAQRVAEGQDQKLREMSARYGELLAEQRSRVMDMRRGILTGDDGMTIILDAIPGRAAELEDQIGRDKLAAGARLVLLSCLDQAWSDHLAYATATREGIHLRFLAREDPTLAFNKLVDEAFAPLIGDAKAEAGRILAEAAVVDGRLDLEGVGLFDPGATWTYMVTDDQFDSASWRAIRGLGRNVKPYLPDMSPI